MVDKVTDKRPQFIWFDAAVIDRFDLDPYSGWLYAVIVRHADKKTGEAFPGVTRLAELSNMSKVQVLRSIARLEGKGLIRVERDTRPAKGENRQMKSNHYFVLPIEGVVSGRDYPSDSQIVGVVSGRDSNQNHLEPESLNQLAPNGAKGTRPSYLFNPYKDTLIAAYGWTWDTATKSEKGQIQAAAAQLYDIEFSVVDIPPLVKYCREKYDNITPPGCCGHVAEWRELNATKRLADRTPNGHGTDNLPSQWDTDNEPIREGVDYT